MGVWRTAQGEGEREDGEKGRKKRKDRWEMGEGEREDGEEGGSRERGREAGGEKGREREKIGGEGRWMGDRWNRCDI